MEYQTGTPEGPEPEDAVDPELAEAWEETENEPVDYEPAEPVEDPLNRLLTMMETLNERLAAVEQGQEEVKILATREPDLDVDYSEFAAAQAGPPEGVRRFESRYSEGTYVKHGARKIIMDGEVVFTPAVQMDFHGGVCDLDEARDAKLIEWAVNHEEYNNSFWENPNAHPRHSTTGLSEGVRDSHVAAPRTGSINVPMQ